MESMLRELHAEKAEELGLVGWGTSPIYLIEEKDLRDSYGRIAGTIAASHGWSYDGLKARIKDNPCGRLGNMPATWTVDARKLAVILRAADAIQIDSRRAPAFLFTILQPEGISLLHWFFQNKLFPPTAKAERLFYKSNQKFKIKENFEGKEVSGIDAWWLCHDTLCMIDRELRDADTFLKETNRIPFKATGVYGLSSSRELSKYIETGDWFPLDTSIRVGDVGQLVSKLGGKQLYGEETEWVPFRELIQNGADAIRARNKLQGRANTEGSILITLNNEEQEPYISFTDNGIGMSESVLTGPFLDFGKSFWHTPLMNREWPGLAAKGFESTGQYGIGFYSVFMWSDNVTVITKKYTAADADTLVLEFRNGTNSRPVLRSATDKERKEVANGGTSVKVILPNKLYEAICTGEVFKHWLSFDDSWAPLDAGIVQRFPCMDCNLIRRINSQSEQMLSAADDWLNLEPDLLYNRLLGQPENSEIRQEEKHLLNHMEYIRNNDDRIVGRAYLTSHSSGEVTIGGCCTVNPIAGVFGGVLFGISEKIDRSIGRLLASDTKILEWMNRQADYLSRDALEGSLDGYSQIKINAFLSCLGLFQKHLYAARIDNNYFYIHEISEVIRKKERDLQFKKLANKKRRNIYLIDYLFNDERDFKYEFSAKQLKNYTFQFIETYHDNDPYWFRHLIKEKHCLFNMVSQEVLDGLGIPPSQQKYCFFDEEGLKSFMANHERSSYIQAIYGSILDKFEVYLKNRKGAIHGIIFPEPLMKV